MKKLLAFLASLRLSVILLVLLLIGLAVGTIVESRADTATAGRMVYYAPWFLALQGIFALNVALSLVDLFPWGKARAGFVVVHASLLLILAGSALTYFFKVEGMLPLWEGETGAVIRLTDDQGRVKAEHELPFTVKLDDFVMDTYPGTRMPSGFASHVQITDRDTGRAFPARIWMNHELHHRGFALYQSSYQQQGGREMTILSVSKDPGQPIAFVGFITLVAGMILVLATRIQQARVRERLAQGRGAAMALLLAAGAVLGAQDATEHIRRLPVQHDGRVMPFDTLAREMVWTITGSHRWQGEDPAATVARWMADPQAAASAPMIRIGSRDLARSLGLDAGTKHISFLGVVQSRPMGLLLQSAQQAEAQGLPRRGTLKDAEALHNRVMALKSVLFNEVVCPLPVAEDPKAPWNPVADPSPQALAALVSGPRPAAWPAPAAIEREVFYNRLNPDRLSWIILLASLVLSVLAWKRSSRALDWAAFGTLVAGFGMMTWGIALRWMVAQRIPAANMYESLLFLAWGVGLFAVIAYAVMRNRVVVLNAAVMATLTMLLTDLLPIDGFIHPIPPVLAGTAWLAIHVPVIMVSYAVLAIAFLIAHGQMFVMAATPERSQLVKTIDRLHYLYVLAGAFLLLIGIATGSMWAASSWGRYWGWDPMYVFALLLGAAVFGIVGARLAPLTMMRWLGLGSAAAAVVVCALVRGPLGDAVKSILAFWLIIMTYVGVNFVLGTGLHSYGFGTGAVVHCLFLFGTIDLILVLVCVGVYYLRYNPGPACARVANRLH